MINDILLSKIKEIDILIADIRSKVLEIYNGSSSHNNPLNNDNGREFTKPLLIKQLDYENKTDEFDYLMNMI